MLGRASQHNLPSQCWSNTHTRKNLHVLIVGRDALSSGRRSCRQRPPPPRERQTLLYIQTRDYKRTPRRCCGLPPRPPAKAVSVSSVLIYELCCVWRVFVFLYVACMRHHNAVICPRCWVCVCSKNCMRTSIPPSATEPRQQK